jgi:cytochrome c-type biogenesis protein CcmH/NrfG
MAFERNVSNVCDIPLITDWQNVCLDTGEYAAALAAGEDAGQLDLENVDQYVALAWLLATHPDKRLRDGKRAVRLARKALALGSAHPSLLETLAAAHAEAGDFEEAVYWRIESLGA